MHISMTLRAGVYLAFVCSLLIVTGSTANATLLDKPVAARARLGRPFDIKPRHEVRLQRENLRIEFIFVKDDSRCPKTVTCVWAGNASVLLEVSVRGKSSKRLLLNTDGGPKLPNQDTYRGYRVKLVRLTPYPLTGERIPEFLFTATLLVTKE